MKLQQYLHLSTTSLQEINCIMEMRTSWTETTFTHVQIHMGAPTSTNILVLITVLQGSSALKGGREGRRERVKKERHKKGRKEASNVTSDQTLWSQSHDSYSFRRLWIQTYQVFFPVLQIRSQSFPLHHYQFIIH
jgi:hypothetical protein